MLDSPRLTSASIAVRRDPPTVEDLRSTTVPDDPVQRRDLILIERARSGDLDAFNDLVVLYQDSPVRARRPHGARPRPGLGRGPGGVLLGVPEPGIVPWRQRQVVARTGSASTPRWTPSVPASDVRSSRIPELEDESWQPPAGDEADPERIAVHAERSRALAAALAQITDDQRTAIVLYDVEGYDYARDRRDDRRLPGDGQVAHPPRPTGPARPARGPDGAVPWLTGAPMRSTTGS